MPSTLWILTEERPKPDVLATIMRKFAADRDVELQIRERLRLVPVVGDSGLFQFEYRARGYNCSDIVDVRLAIITGNSSFTDFLVYFQDEAPGPEHIPVYAIEETKTDDSESRNTGVFQRATKFVYLDLFYPSVERAMLYNLRVQAGKPTATNVFGSRCLATLGVEILGKDLSYEAVRPFESVEELIELKNAMKLPPAGNVPVRLSQQHDRITVSGRLIKAGSLSHDPSIGTLSVIGGALRALGWVQQIVITEHGLEQPHLRPSNKFVQVAEHLSMDFEGLVRPKSKPPSTYWRYDNSGEKVTTIFLDIAIEESELGRVIYSNHAGGERGYLFDKQGSPIAVSKRLKSIDGSMPKQNEKVNLPDLVLHDVLHNQLINIEGERTANLHKGIRQLDGFTAIEDEYLKPAYPECEIERCVVLFGGRTCPDNEPKIALHISDIGTVTVPDSAPSLIEDSVKRFLRSWNSSVG